MSFTNIKIKGRSEAGFTIVELLIVVVVIAILAAITIVSYNGITARANQSSAKATAATIQKKSELYNNDSGNNRYPAAATDLQSAAASTSYYVPNNVTILFQTAALTSTNGSNTVRILKCGTGATQSAITTPVGLKIFYYDAVAGAETTSPLSSGDNTNCPTS